MTALSSNVRVPAGHVPSNVRWWALGTFMLSLLAAGVWSAADVLQRTKSLNDLTTRSLTVSIRLERAIGYGGLIHNFKNFVLRPTELRYYRDAMANAKMATELIELLDANLRQVGIETDLVHTGVMIKTYRSRLNQVRELSRRFTSAEAIDQRVKFDDELAMAESSRLMEELIRTVETRIAALRRNAVIALSLISALVLGLILVAFSTWHSRRHLETIRLNNIQLLQSNRKLSTANESLQQFAGIVSHHLKTPLRHIGFHCDELTEVNPEDGSLAAHASRVKQCVAEMDRITDSLLDYTQTGSQSLEFETLDLTSLVDTVCDRFAADIDRLVARVEVRGSTMVSADRQLLSRVFDNLIGNSLKYAKEGVAPVIVIEQDDREGTTVISVTDNGIGMVEKHTDEAFRPLHRLHVEKSGVEGVGMGLALVRSIISSHGGRVWVDTGQRDGTRICFELPSIEALRRVNTG